MNEYLETLHRDMGDKDFATRQKANECLLAYDFGRAKSEKERDNARSEWSLRMWLVSGYTFKEAYKLSKKYK